MKKIIAVYMITCSTLLYPLKSVATQIIAHDYRLDNLSMNIAFGYLGGTSNEYVYDPDTGDKMSQLNWSIQQAAIIKADLSYTIWSWLTADANGWTTLARGQARMDDYDWEDPNQPLWTDWSHHTNTDLNYANEFDLNLKGWILQNNYYKLGATAGYQRNNFSFLAKDGCFTYNNGLYQGCIIGNVPTIGYAQTFETVYFGLAGKYFTNNVEFTTLLKFGPVVTATDVDEHYLRNITFEESGNDSKFYSAKITAGYYLTHDYKLFLETAYDQFTNTKADGSIFAHDTGEVFSFHSSAGLSNYNYTIAVGVQYTG